MGCFNKIGFYSNLPIMEDDEIVYFPCVYFKGSKIDDTPIGTCYPLSPFCLPLIGKYNDCGSIKDIDDISNKHIEDFFGITAEKLVKFIENFSDYSEHENIKDDDKWMIGFNDKINLMLDNAYNEYIKHEIEITYTIELLDVYNKISSMNFHNLYTNEDKYDENFDKIYDILLKNNAEYNIVSGSRVYSSHLAKKDLFYIELELLELNNKLIFEDLSFICQIYNDKFIYEDYVKEHIRNFNRFNRGLSYLCGKYCLSSYGYQDLSFKHHIGYYKELNDAYSEIINKIYEKGYKTEK